MYNSYRLSLISQTVLLKISCRYICVYLGNFTPCICHFPKLNRETPGMRRSRTMCTPLLKSFLFHQINVSFLLYFITDVVMCTWGAGRAYPRSPCYCWWRLTNDWGSDILNTDIATHTYIELFILFVYVFSY